MSSSSQSNFQTDRISKTTPEALEHLTAPARKLSVRVELPGGESPCYSDLIDRMSALEEESQGTDSDNKAEKLSLLMQLEDALELYFQNERVKLASGALSSEELLAQLRSLDQVVGALAEYTYADFYFWHLIGLEANNPRSEEMAANMTPFIPSPLNRIETFLQEARILPSDTVVDLGSGHGPVVPFVALFSEARKVIGVDYLAHHAETGNRIAKELDLKNVEFRGQDARHFDFSQGDIFFLYQPFSGPILEQVVRALSQEALRRDIKVFCTGSCGREFERSGSFKRTDYFSVQDEWSPRLLRSAFAAREVMLDPTFAFLQS